MITPRVKAPRIEASLLNAGSDFDADVSPFATGLGHMVDLEKADFSGMRRLRSHIIDESGATRLESMHKLV